MRQTEFRYSSLVIAVPLFLILIIWMVFLAELRLGINLNTWGVYPRTLRGLRGIVTSPFIHGSVRHLYNNTIPLAILSAALFYFYRHAAWKTLLLGGLLAGLLTWLIGRPSYHIGASGLIYLLASFIFFKGMLSRHYRLVALSLIVVFVYGGMLWYVFPIKEGISWEGHLSGALAGLFLAFALRTPLPPKPKYAWESPDYKEEEDPFMQHFDADGNFIESPGEVSEFASADENETAEGAKTATWDTEATGPQANVSETDSKTIKSSRVSDRHGKEPETIRFRYIYREEKKGNGGSGPPVPGRHSKFPASGRTPGRSVPKKDSGNKADGPDQASEAPDA